MAQSILITGASSEIGRNIALELAGSGASIALHCNQNLQAITELQPLLTARGCREGTL